MRIGYLDCVGGISGDMFVGSLLDAGWPERDLRETVAWLGDEIEGLEIERRRQHHFAGLGIRVTPSGAAPDARGLAEILALLAGAPLPAAVRERAAGVFRRLARAEARAHGVALERVHFHEVGAVDALVDIVGACAGLAALGIERLHVSPLPLARGRAESAHGTMPLPAPAAALLLEGLAVEWVPGEGERCTPTGAALVAELGVGSLPPRMIVSAVGTGAGTLSFPDVPNVARLFVGEWAAPAEATPAAAAGSELPGWGWEAGEGAARPGGSDEAPSVPGLWDRVAVLATQIDDATPEDLAWLCEDLRGAGALEVFLQGIQMKKGRAGVLLTVIARPADEPALMARLLARSSTLGVRRRLEWRRELDRREGWLETRYGPIRIKWASRGRAGWTGEPEFESCREAASRAGVSLSLVKQAAYAALAGSPGPEPADRSRPTAEGMR